MSLQLVISRLQALFEAAGHKWCDKDYIVGFLSIRNEDLEAKFAANGMAYQEEWIVLPAVPAQTSDLSSYQTPGNLLGDMMLPYSLEWRVPGQPDTAFAPVPLKDKVLDTDPNSPINGIASWAWTRGIIQISASAIAVDIRVGCDLLPDVFQSDSDNYIPGSTNVLTYWTSETIAKSRGGPASKFGVEMQAKGEAAWSDVEALMVQQTQRTRRRIGGRRSMGGGPRWRLPNNL